MQNPSFPLLQFRSKELSTHPVRQDAEQGFFDTHPVGDLVRSLLVSSVLWGLLAFAVYTVYTMIVGAH